MRWQKLVPGEKILDVSLEIWVVIRGVTHREPATIVARSPHNGEEIRLTWSEDWIYYGLDPVRVLETNCIAVVQVR
ncbi:MAG: hypothetical protein WC609_01160 [Candidatus Paceibacterota bacterium]